MTRKFTNGRAPRAGAGAEQSTEPGVPDREGADPEPRYHVPRLVITRGRGAGHDEAVGTKCLIGRSPESDVVVPDPSVSWRHARISLQDEEYVIHDLGSLNGTIVNGRRIQAATLRDRDVIHLGRVELLFRVKKFVGEIARTRHWVS